jgi:exoribonuclease-2
MSKPDIQTRPGCLVEFLQDNQPVLAWVQQEQGSSLKVLSINKRDQKVPLSRILPWTGPVYPADSSRSEALELLRQHNERRRTIFQDIDAREIWELTCDEIREGRIEWFAGLLWQEPDVDHLAALGQALLQLKTHFKFQPPVFKVYDSETVTRRLAEMEAARRRHRFISHGQVFFKSLWEQVRKGGSAAHIEEPPDDVADELKRILLSGVSDPEDREFQDLWNDLSPELPNKPHLPLILAQAWGVLPPHHNYLLDQAAYAWGDEWSSAFAREISEQEAAFERLEQPPEPLSLMSIDSSTTRDIDDAFCLSWGAETGYHLRLALACPVLTWPFGSALDREVAHRASSLYLPEGSSHMLPEALGTRLFSLHAGLNRPVLLVDLRLDSNGQVQQTELRPTWTAVDKNTTYSQVENELDIGRGSAELQHALALADRLRARRLQNGAVIMEQEEPAVRVLPGQEDVEVQLDTPSTHPKAQLVVSEFMILANQAVSEWASQRGIPLVHRTQKINLSPGCSGVWRDPVDIFRIMQEMSSSRLDITPGRHTSLGLDGYAPITSPLRRYIDFLNMHQIVSALHSGTPARSAEELERSMPELSSRLQAATQIQRSRTRYWKLLYLKRWCKVLSWTGILVGENGQSVTLSLPREQLFVRAPTRLFESKRHLGQRYQLRLGHIDPLNNEIKIQSAWGDDT